MSTEIYRNPCFKVYRAGSGFIVHNTSKSFEMGHTHIQKYSTCMVIIKLLMSKKIPHSRSKYFLESLIRLSDDEAYKDKIEHLLKSA